VPFRVEEHVEKNLPVRWEKSGDRCGASPPSSLSRRTDRIGAPPPRTLAAELASRGKDSRVRVLVLPLIPALSGGNGVRESGGLFLDCRGDVDEQGQNHKAKYHTNADEDLVDRLSFFEKPEPLVSNPGAARGLLQLGQLHTTRNNCRAVEFFFSPERRLHPLPDAFQPAPSVESGRA